MVHVGAVRVGIIGETEKQANAFVLRQDDRFLQSHLFGRRRRAVSVEDPKLHVVNMEPMGHHRSVLDLPYLRGSDARGLVDVVHIHRFSIDRKGTATPHHSAHAHAQDEAARADRAGRIIIASASIQAIPKELGFDLMLNSV